MKTLAVVFGLVGMMSYQTNAQGYAEAYYSYSYGYQYDGMFYDWNLPHDVYITLNDVYRHHNIVDVRVINRRGPDLFEVVLVRNGAYVVVEFDPWGRIFDRYVLPRNRVVYFNNLYRNRYYTYVHPHQVEVRYRPPRVVYRDFNTGRNNQNRVHRAEPQRGRSYQERPSSVRYEGSRERSRSGHVSGNNGQSNRNRNTHVQHNERSRNQTVTRSSSGSRSTSVDRSRGKSSGSSRSSGSSSRPRN